MGISSITIAILGLLFHFCNMKLKPILLTLLHIGIWAFLFFFPLLLVDSPKFQATYWKRSLIPMLFYALVFYFNYFYLVDYKLFKRKYGQFVAIDVLLIVMSAFSILYLYILIFHGGEIPEPKKGRSFPWMLVVIKDIFFFSMVVGFAIAIRATNRIFKEEKRREQEESERLKSELTYLKYQLQPHFFFNTLNNIYALIDAFPDRAKDTVLKLSKLMRYVLYKSTEPKVPLQAELDFIQNYVELMRIRYANHVQIEMQLPKIDQGYQIPPLLIVPLLENAFKHGVDATKKSFITIELAIEKDDFNIIIQNSYFPKNDTDESGSGIGLENLKKRLDLLYHPKDYTFAHQQEGEIYQTHLSLSLNPK